MGKYTYEIYEVPNSYVESGTAPTISGVFSIEIRDNDKNLDADEAADPGKAQRIYIDGDRVDDYQFFYDDIITINGGTETIKTFQLTIDGTVRSFVMNDSSHNLPGVGVGTSFTLDSYATYTSVPYKDFACFARGARIRTDCGDIAVEDLKLGDLVETMDNGFQPIRWIGSSKLSIRDLITLPHMRPITIAPGSLGPNLPENELRLSPQHRVLLSGWSVQLNFGLDEIFAPAKSIIGRAGVSVDQNCRDVEYFHFMFDNHEVVFSEGLPTESFLVGDTIRNGMDKDQLAEIEQLFPELAKRESGEYIPPARPILRKFEVNSLDALAA